MAHGRHSTDRARPGDSRQATLRNQSLARGGGVSDSGLEGRQGGCAGMGLWLGLPPGLLAGPHGPSGFKSHPSCPVSGPTPFPTDQSTFVIMTWLSTHTHTLTHTHTGQQVCTSRPGEAGAPLPKPIQGPIHGSSAAQPCCVTSKLR